MHIVNNTYKKWLTFNVSEDFKKLNMTTDLYDIKDLNFKQSSDYTAKLIADLGKEIYVSLSGGLDSEYVAEVFRKNNIPFKVIGFVNPFNLTEIEYAYHYCKKYNIEAVWLECSKEKMFKIGELFIKKHGVDIFPNWLPQIYIDGYLKNQDVIIVDGNLHMINDPWPSPFHILIPELYADIFGKVPHIHFYNYTAEIFKACMLELDITLNTQEAKAKLFDLAFRPKLCSMIPRTQEEFDREIKFNQMYLNLTPLITSDNYVSKKVTLDIVNNSTTI